MPVEETKNGWQILLTGKNRWKRSSTQHTVDDDRELLLLILNLTIVRRTFFWPFFWIFTKWLGSFRGEALSPDICYISYLTDASGIPLKVTISGKRKPLQKALLPSICPTVSPSPVITASHRSTAFSQVDNYVPGSRMSAYKPKIYRSQDGCCICKAKSSRL